jgi:hypothetical protein
MSMTNVIGLFFWSRLFRFGAGEGGGQAEGDECAAGDVTLGAAETNAAAKTVSYSAGKQGPDRVSLGRPTLQIFQLGVLFALMGWCPGRKCGEACARRWRLAEVANRRDVECECRDRSNMRRPNISQIEMRIQRKRAERKVRAWPRQRETASDDDAHDRDESRSSSVADAAADDVGYCRPGIMRSTAAPVTNNTRDAWLISRGTPSFDSENAGHAISESYKREIKISGSRNRLRSNRLLRWVGRKILRSRRLRRN